MVYVINCENQPYAMQTSNSKTTFETRQGSCDKRTPLQSNFYTKHELYSRVNIRS